MSIERLYSTPASTALDALYTARGKREPTSGLATPASWGADTIDISPVAWEELRKSTMEKPTGPEPECLLTINGKKTDIAKCLRDLADKDPAMWCDVMNSLTHGGPEDFAQALSVASGESVGSVKAALQEMNASQGAEFAKQLGELAGVPPSIFKKSLASLTGISSQLLEKHLKELLGTDYREAEGLPSSYTSHAMRWNTQPSS